jgi:hypothetical protein
MSTIKERQDAEFAHGLAERELAAVVYDDLAFQQYIEGDRYLAFAMNERMTNVDGTARDPAYIRAFREALFNSEIRENSHESRRWSKWLAARVHAARMAAGERFMEKINATTYAGTTNEELMRARHGDEEDAALIAELTAALREMREVAALCFRVMADHSPSVDRFTAEATALGLTKGFGVRADAALAHAEKARAG